MPSIHTRSFDFPFLTACLFILLPFYAAAAELQTPGDVVKGRSVTEANLASFEPKDWPLERFEPDAGQVGSALALIAGGLLITLAIGRLSRNEDS